MLAFERQERPRAMDLLKSVARVSDWQTGHCTCCYLGERELQGGKKIQEDSDVKSKTFKETKRRQDFGGKFIRGKAVVQDEAEERTKPRQSHTQYHSNQVMGGQAGRMVEVGRLLRQDECKATDKEEGEKIADGVAMRDVQNEWGRTRQVARQSHDERVSRNRAEVSYWEQDHPKSTLQGFLERRQRERERGAVSHMREVAVHERALKLERDVREQDRLQREIRQLEHNESPAPLSGPYASEIVNLEAELRSMNSRTHTQQRNAARLPLPSFVPRSLSPPSALLYNQRSTLSFSLPPGSPSMRKPSGNHQYHSTTDEEGLTGIGLQFRGLEQQINTSPMTWSPYSPETYL